MSDNALARIKERFNEYQNRLTVARQQLSGVGATPTARVHAEQEVEDLESRVNDLREVLQELEEAYAQLEHVKEKLEKERDEAESKKRMLGIDPKGWFDSQKQSIEEGWKKLDEERSQIVQDREEVRVKTAALELAEAKRKTLRNEIRLWGQNMLIFISLLLITYFVQGLIPGEYRLPFSISMVIFSVFPLVAVVITTYNIYRY